MHCLLDGDGETLKEVNGLEWITRDSCCASNYFLGHRNGLSNTIQYNTIKYLYSAYNHRVSRALRRRELISNVQKSRF